jgi:NADPH:quinone reductase
VTHTRILVTHYGGPDALQVVEEERPEPKHNEVRVRVLAAGVSLPDVMMREGIHPETPRLPFTPGWDLVGIVDRPGSSSACRKMNWFRCHRGWTRQSLSASF